MSNSSFKDGHALVCVPDEVKTHELCLAAASDNGYALQFVPDEFKTSEVCIAAVSKGKGVHWCVFQIQKERGALVCVPDEFKTSELCLAAVTNMFQLNL